MSHRVMSFLKKLSFHQAVKLINYFDRPIENHYMYKLVKNNGILDLSLAKHVIL